MYLGKREKRELVCTWITWAVRLSRYGGSKYKKDSEWHRSCSLGLMSLHYPLHVWGFY